jgi:hypothetical protein
MKWGVLPVLMKSIGQGLGEIGQNPKKVLMNGLAGLSQSKESFEDPTWR